MNLPIFITRRLVQGTPRKGRRASRTVIAIAIGAIAISMAVMIVAVSIVTGFQQQVRNKVIGFGSHIVVEPISRGDSFEGSPIANADSLAKSLRGVEGVTIVQPYAMKAAMFKTGEEIENIVIKGLPKNYDDSFLQTVLADGRLPVISDTSKEMLISTYTARRLNVKTGDKLLVYFLVKNDIRKRKYTITGLIDSGFEEFDKAFAFVDIAQIQQLNGWEPKTAAGLEVRITDFNHIDETNEAINQLLPAEIEAKTIKELRSDIFVWLDMQDINGIIIIVLMLFVSIVNVVSAMLVLVLERTPMIGILKAMGSNNGSIRMVFINYAAYLLGRGLILGNLLGLGICIAQLQFHIIKLPKESYYVDTVPVLLNPLHIVGINAVTIAFSVLVLWVTSLVIRRISPVKAIRLK